jgi:hypothetical protein
MSAADIDIRALDLDGEERRICITDLAPHVVIQDGSGEHAATRIYTEDEALRLAEAITLAVRTIRKEAA